MPSNFMNDPRYQYLGGNMGGSPLAGGGAPPGFGGFGAPSSLGLMGARPSLGNSLAMSFMQPQSPQPVIPNFPNAPGMAPQGGGGSLGTRILDGLGGFAGQAGQFLGGNDGANGLQLGALALSAWDAMSQNKRYDEEKRRRDELEDEQRRRYDANAPARAALAGQFTSRLG